MITTRAYRFRSVVNCALIAIKRRSIPAPANGYVAPSWVPVVGLITSICLLISEALFVKASQFENARAIKNEDFQSFRVLLVAHSRLCFRRSP